MKVHNYSQDRAAYAVIDFRITIQSTRCPVTEMSVAIWVAFLGLTYPVCVRRLGIVQTGGGRNELVVQLFKEVEYRSLPKL